MLHYVRDFILPAAYALLPTEMGSQAASAMLLAIGLQESEFEHRHQVGGPAHGFWQFERGGGVHGVLAHSATAPHIDKILRLLKYNVSTGDCYTAIEHNDVLAACFARLLLWTVPRPLPGADEADAGWQQYLDSWRPGRPHYSTWATYYEMAWQLVERR
jgi:hypothetical protein